MTHAPQTSRLFVVRVGHDPQRHDARAFRGTVREVASGRELAFSNLTDLSDFIALRLGGDRKP